MSERDPTDFDKGLDLHESEWGHENKKQPVFGAGASWFFRVVVPTVVVTLVFGYFWSFIVHGLADWIAPQ